jgi:hypothetical protein
VLTEKLRRASVGSVLFDDGLPAWQRMVGAMLYVPLVAPLTIWFARTVVGVPGQVDASIPAQVATI